MGPLLPGVFDLITSGMFNTSVPASARTRLIVRLRFRSLWLSLMPSQVLRLLRLTKLTRSIRILKARGFPASDAHGVKGCDFASGEPLYIAPQREMRNATSQMAARHHSHGKSLSRILQGGARFQRGSRNFAAGRCWQVRFCCPIASHAQVLTRTQPRVRTLTILCALCIGG